MVAALLCGVCVCVCMVAWCGGLSVFFHESDLSLSLLSAVGLTYTLEYKDALSDPAWTPIPPAVPGTGGPLSFQDTNALTSPARFYRVTAAP